jgi:hypothetical protein
MLRQSGAAPQIPTGEPTEHLAEDRSPTPGNSTRQIPCDSIYGLNFNVMPGRPVKEELSMKEFRVGPDWIEAEFDRKYYSSMLNSPNHLTFIAALIQMQKVTYVYACHRLGFVSDVKGPEVLKVWPTSVNVTLRDLVREEKSLVHRMDFTVFRRVEARKYLATTKSRIGIMRIDASAMIMPLREPPCSTE